MTNFPTPGQIQSWLDRQGISRGEFAERIGYSLSSVHHWLSPGGSRKIPRRALISIARLMEALP